MHLASIISQEENDKLEKYIKDFGKKVHKKFKIIYVSVNVIMNCMVGMLIIMKKVSHNKLSCIK